jgi:hypothetical protein
MDAQGKVIPTSSTFAFLGALFLGVPVWLTVVLPLSVIHQVGLALTKPFRSTPEFSFDTGTQVAPSVIIPREKRKYDVVVLGATGFTGKLVVEYIANTYGGKHLLYNMLRYVYHRSVTVLTNDMNCQWEKMLNGPLLGETKASWN